MQCRTVISFFDIEHLIKSLYDKRPTRQNTNGVMVLSITNIPLPKLTVLIQIMDVFTNSVPGNVVYIVFKGRSRLTLTH